MYFRFSTSIFISISCQGNIYFEINFEFWIILIIELFSIKLF